MLLYTLEISIGNTENRLSRRNNGIIKQGMFVFHQRYSIKGFGFWRIGKKPGEAREKSNGPPRLEVIPTNNL